MGRRKIIRPEEEEAEFKKAKREKKNEQQRNRRKSKQNDPLNLLTSNISLQPDCSMLSHNRHNNVNNINENPILENYIGQMNVLCMHCNAKHFKNEMVSNKGNSFNDCCRHGEVNLDPPPDFPILF